MLMLLVVPDCNILPAPEVVQGSLTLRKTGLRVSPTSGTGRSRGINPSQDRAGRRVAFPPRRLEGWAGRLGHPELMGVLLTGGVVEVGGGRH